MARWDNTRHMSKLWTWGDDQMKFVGPWIWTRTNGHKQKMHMEKYELDGTQNQMRQHEWLTNKVVRWSLTKQNQAQWVMKNKMRLGFMETSLSEDPQIKVLLHQEVTVESPKLTYVHKLQEIPPVRIWLFEIPLDVEKPHFPLGASTKLGIQDTCPLVLDHDYENEIKCL